MRSVTGEGGTAVIIIKKSIIIFPPYLDVITIMILIDTTIVMDMKNHHPREGQQGIGRDRIHTMMTNVSSINPKAAGDGLDKTCLLHLIAYQRMKEEEGGREMANTNMPVQQLVYHHRRPPPLLHHHTTHPIHHQMLHHMLVLWQKFVYLTLWPPHHHHLIDHHHIRK